MSHGISIADLAVITGADEAELTAALDEGEAQRAQQHSAEIIPFPIARQQHRVRRELISVSEYETSAAFRYLKSVVRKHRSRLEKLGVSPERIAADVRALEDALGLTG
jgi:hypothetical protein